MDQSGRASNWNWMIVCQTGRSQRMKMVALRHGRPILLPGPSYSKYHLTVHFSANHRSRSSNFMTLNCPFSIKLMLWGQKSLQLNKWILIWIWTWIKIIKSFFCLNKMNFGLNLKIQFHVISFKWSLWNYVVPTALGHKIASQLDAILRLFL